MAEDAAEKKLEALKKLLDKKHAETEAELKKAKTAKGKIDTLTRESSKVVDE